MIPSGRFVRTVREAEQVTGLLAANGLARGQNGLKVIMMCELPTNALLAAEYLEFFDGMSIGSNDMTQMTLALDRDSSIIARRFDERDAVPAFYWVDQGFGYALAGKLSRADLLQLATAVNNQLMPAAAPAAK